MVKNIGIIAFVIFGIMFSFAAEDKTPSTMAEIIKQIENNEKTDTTSKLISDVLDLVSKESKSSITDDLDLFSCLTNYDNALDIKLKNTNKLIDILSTKYRNNPEEKMMLLLREIVLYRNIVQDKDKLANVVSQVEALNIALQNKRAISQLKELVELGISYRYLPGGDGPGEVREKSRKYLIQAINFPVFSSVYTQETSDILRDLYVEAAVELVRITSGREELSKLQFDPYSWGDIKRAYPDKFKSISKNTPGIGVTQRTVERWLSLCIKDEKEGSEIRKQLEAVLLYLITPPIIPQQNK